MYIHMYIQMLSASQHTQSTNHNTDKRLPYANVPSEDQLHSHLQTHLSPKHTSPDLHVCELGAKCHMSTVALAYVSTCKYM